MFITSVVLLSICLVQLKSYISPKYLEFPLLYTKKGLPRKQANRRRSPITPPPLGQVPQIIIDMLVGSLLGDAFGSIPTGGVNPVFEIKQSTIHSEYLFYMYFIFLHWGYSNLSFPIPYWTGDGNGNSHQYLRFRTIANAGLMAIFEAFYSPAWGKILPINISDLLTPRALAFWIMDDGGAHVSGMTLHCNNFTEVEVDILIKLLLTKFDLVANKWEKGDRHIIYITAGSMPTLRRLVAAHVHTSFHYKLGAIKG